MVPPDGFIATAEESGLIVPIGRWVLERACRQMSLWQQRGGSGFGSVAVNLSARQLAGTDLLDTVERALDASGLAPRSLTLEITESALMVDVTTALATLRALQGLGVRIAIDDFGTGYSSLSQLHQLPLDVLKVDRTFVRRLDDDGGDDGEGAEILAAIVKLGHALHLQVVAEGVETSAQAQRLRSMGCDLAQGYLYGKPVPASDYYRAVVGATA
jgi:EAL domain-containing protein (putative c-di-GMP-specific phosphodiesterase class I)